MLAFFLKCFKMQLVKRKMTCISLLLAATLVNSLETTARKRIRPCLTTILSVSWTDSYARGAIFWKGDKLGKWLCDPAWLISPEFYSFTVSLYVSLWAVKSSRFGSNQRHQSCIKRLTFRLKLFILPVFLWIWPCVYMPKTMGSRFMVNINGSEAMTWHDVVGARVEKYGHVPCWEWLFKGDQGHWARNSSKILWNNKELRICRTQFNRMAKLVYILQILRPHFVSRVYTAIWLCKISALVWKQ